MFIKTHFSQTDGSSLAALCGEDDGARVKRQEAPEKLMITQVSQQCPALSTATAVESKESRKGHFAGIIYLIDVCQSRFAFQNGQAMLLLFLITHNIQVKRYFVCFPNPLLSNIS